LHREVNVENQAPQQAPATSSSSAWLYPLVIVLALVIFGVGIYLLVSSSTNEATRLAGAALLAAGCVAFIAALATWPIAMAVHHLRSAGLKHQEELLATLGDRLQQVSVMLNLISEQQLISDRAKSVAFRENERDALRRAIREEIGKRDWEAALRLADDIERAFGYKQEADAFRAEIVAQRDGLVRKQINDALGIIEKHCKAELWADAIREGERIRSLFPNVEQVQNLPQEIEQRRLRHKQQLIDSWNDAVARHDVDGAIEILKKLDLYLTPSEAESMQETVRGVFKEKLNNLRTQFGLAVQDHKWTEAIRIGDEIVRGFPNTKAAQEVREKMDVLRQRASEDQGAAVPAGA
jgi:hypothetical protein